MRGALQPTILQGWKLVVDVWALGKSSDEQQYVKDRAERLVAVEEDAAAVEALGA